MASQYRSGPKEKQEMEGLHKLHEFEWGLSKRLLPIA